MVVAEYRVDAGVEKEQNQGSNGNRDRLQQVAVVDLFKPSDSWFEQVEKVDCLEETDELNRGCLSPRSSLKIVDEAMEFELCQIADKGTEEAIENRGLTGLHVQSLSENEGEDEIEELVTKCFNSDSEIDAPMKNLRGTKKKKATVVLEGTTRSNKPY